MKRNALTNTLHILEIALIIGMLFFYLVTLITLEKSDILDSHGVEWKEGWNRVLEDGTYEPVGYPIWFPTERGVYSTVANIIPEDLKWGDRIIFFSGQNTYVTIDGKLRYEFHSEDNPLPGLIVKTIIHEIDLNENDRGKEIRITKGEDYDKNCSVQFIAIGDTKGLFNLMFQYYGMNFMLSMTVLLFAVVMTGLNVIMNIRLHNHIHAYGLIFGTMLVALWALADNMLYQYMFPKLFIDGFMGYVLVMIMPFPFIIHLNRMQHYRYQKWYSVIECVLLVNFTANMLLQCFTMHSFIDQMVFIGIAVGSAVAFAVFTIIKDAQNGYMKEYYDLAIGYACLCLFGLLELIQVNFHFLYKSFDSIFLMIGVFLLLMHGLLMLLRMVREESTKAMQALKANETKTNFLAKMSHEIRTPISAVLGLNEMILRETKEPGIRAYAIDIQAAGKSLLALVNDILDLTKVESGKLEIFSVEYETSAMLRETLNMIQTKVRAKELKVITELDETMPSKLIGDDLRIRQVLVNLLNNAINYTEKGSVTLKVASEVVGNKAHIHFSVTDTGRGIKEEDLPKIYQMFTRIEENKNRSIEGTGLGMTITVNLLKLMGSHLEVTSEYGVGSCFYFTLEQEIADSTPMGKINEPMERDIEAEFVPGLIAEDALILVVDDNAINRKVVRHLLKATKIRIEEADNGETCLLMCTQKQYDVILLDHMMPGMDGIETLQKMKADIKSMNRNTPVIALTANAVVGAREQYLQVGFDAFLTKPIMYEKMENVLKHFIPQEKIQAKATSSGEQVSYAQEKAKQVRSSTDLLAMEDSILDKESFENYLKTLVQAIDALDINMADATVLSLKKLMYPVRYQPIMKEIYDAVANVDDDKLKEYVEKALQL